MVAITVSQADLNSLSKADLEKYLEGSGKPIGAPFQIEGEQVTWGEDVHIPTPEPTPTPIPEPTPEEDATPDVDLASMSKQAIINYVAEKTGTSLSTKLKKDDLIAAAVGIL